jgi:hypothetical protein
MALEELAEEGLAAAVRIDIRRVDEVAAGLEEGVEDGAALVLGRAPALVLAERHRAEAKLRDPQAGMAEQSISHDGIKLQSMGEGGGASVRSPGSQNFGARPRPPLASR